MGYYMEPLILRHSTRLIFAALIAFVWGVVSSYPGEPTTLWVDDDDPTCGGHSPCYQTIQEAVAAAQPGDTIKIRPGTYQGQIIISKDLTLSGESRELVFIHNRDWLGERPWEAIRVTGRATITIENVSIIDSLIGILAEEAHVTLSRLQLSKNFIAVRVFKGQLTLMENRLSSNYYVGVHVNTDSSLPNYIEGNQFQENEKAIYVDRASHMIIRGNEIHSGGIGINLAESVEAFLQANTIRNNTIGIYVDQSSRASLEENQILGNALNGVVVRGSAQATLVRNHIVGNGFSLSFAFVLAQVFYPEGFGVAVGESARVELTENRFEGNMFGLGATQALDRVSARQVLTPQITAQRNEIIANGWGVLLQGAVATLSHNEIAQNDIAALVTNSILLYFDAIYPSSGVLVQAGQPLLGANHITQNRRGVVLQREASPTLQSNRIMKNIDYGVALYRRPCFDFGQADDPLLMFQGKVFGEGNELSGNGKADLCPPDYPWPPGFRK